MINGLKLHIAAISLAVITAFIIFLLLSNKTFKEKPIEVNGLAVKTSGFHPNLSKNQQAEIDYLGSILNPEQLTIFGSSEFSASPLCSFNFFPEKLGTPALGIGHAYHQHLSILGELLYAESGLENSKVVIFISPTWFNTKGTNSQAFMEFFTPEMLSDIYTNPSIKSEYKIHLGQFIANQENQFKGLTKEMMAYKENYFSTQGNLPASLMSKSRTALRAKYPSRYALNPVSKNVKPAKFSPQTSDFQFSAHLLDSLASEFLSYSRNNDILVNDDYYSKYLSKTDGTHKTGKFKSVDFNSNPEYEDFKLVLKLLSSKNADATFVIIPINPYYYSGLEHAVELADQLTTDISANNFSVLNMMPQSKTDYKAGTLKDVMHLGDVGWMKINKFLHLQYAEK